MGTRSGRWLVAAALGGLLALGVGAVSCRGERPEGAAPVALPEPARSGGTSLQETLNRRRSVREFQPTPLKGQEIGQLAWACQGVTAPGGLRTAPSAGALYPLELYVMTAEGHFHYQPASHSLERQAGGDLRAGLAAAALGQECVRGAPAVFVIAGVYERTAARYGPERAPRYVHLEAGHAAQNLLLQATALGLGAVPVGAFDDDRVRAVLSLPPTHRPLYLVPVGHPR